MLVKIILKYIIGYVRISVEGYYIERFINICKTNKILIWNIKREKGVKIYLNIGINDFYKTIKIAKKMQCKIKIEKKQGIPFIVNRYRKRKLFFISLIFISILLYASSNYIWNVEYVFEGGITLENLEPDIQDAGLKVGMRKNQINEEEIINKIRLKRNDISWIGINIKGTNAIIKVVKAKDAPELINENEYTNIIAKKAGTITQIIAQNGTALVNVGDYVEEGQNLIQGTMEGKYTGIRYVHSLGEIKAIVQYQNNIQIPLKKVEKVKTGKKETKYEINFNKIKINFYKTLSKFKIYDTIEEEKKLRIFSNLYLPISVKKITNEELDENVKEYSEEEAIEEGTKQLEEKMEEEIDENENILRQKCQCSKNR